MKEVKISIFNGAFVVKTSNGVSYSVYRNNDTPTDTIIEVLPCGSWNVLKRIGNTLLRPKKPNGQGGGVRCYNVSIETLSITRKSLEIEMDRVQLEWIRSTGRYYGM